MPPWSPTNESLPTLLGCGLCEVFCVYKRLGYLFITSCYVVFARYCAPTNKGSFREETWQLQCQQSLTGPSGKEAFNITKDEQAFICPFESKMSTLLLRRATVADLLDMLVVMDEALNNPSTEEELKENMELWTPRFENKDFAFYVLLDQALEGRKMVGWCRGGRVLPQHCLAGGTTFEAEVQNFFLLKDYQGKGYGRQMWNLLWNEVVSMYQPKNLVVWSVAGATGFYRKLGGTELESKTSSNYTSTAFGWDTVEPKEIEENTNDDTSVVIELQR